MSRTVVPDHQPRVLYLTKVLPFPPAVAGDAVYSRGIIDALSATCALTVVCADNGNRRSFPSSSYASVQWHIEGPQRQGQAGSVASRWPLIAWKSATPSYRKRLTELLGKRWDVIVLDNLGLAHALTEAQAYRVNHPGTKLVYISHEYEYATRSGKYASYDMSVPKALVARRDLAKVKRAEEALLRAADIVTVINTGDLLPFRKIAPRQKYLPFMPGYDGPVTETRQITDQTPRRILLAGGRRSEQKRQILLDWMKVAYEPIKNAGIDMTIVGDMEDSLREILARDYPQTAVLGFVENLDALIADSRMGVIADTVGGGFKLRLLNHVFQRLPIVGLGAAIDGLPTAKDAGYVAATDLTDLVQKVVAVCDEINQLNALHEKAYADCAQAFRWETRAADFVTALGVDAASVLV